MLPTAWRSCWFRAQQSASFFRWNSEMARSFLDVLEEGLVLEGGQNAVTQGTREPEHPLVHQVDEVVLSVNQLKKKFIFFFQTPQWNLTLPLLAEGGRVLRWERIYEVGKPQGTRRVSASTGRRTLEVVAGLVLAGWFRVVAAAVEICWRLVVVEVGELEWAPRGWSVLAVGAVEFLRTEVGALWSVDDAELVEGSLARGGRQVAQGDGAQGAAVQVAGDAAQLVVGWVVGAEFTSVGGGVTKRRWELGGAVEAVWVVIVAVENSHLVRPHRFGGSRRVTVIGFFDYRTG